MNRSCDAAAGRHLVLPRVLVGEDPRLAALRHQPARLPVLPDHVLELAHRAGPVEHRVDEPATVGDRFDFELE